MRRSLLRSAYRSSDAKRQVALLSPSVRWVDLLLSIGLVFCYVVAILFMNPRTVGELAGATRVDSVPVAGRTVALPYFAGVQRSYAVDRITFSHSLPADSSAIDRGFALYFPKYGSDLTMRLNGALLYQDAGPGQRPLRNWHQPRLIQVPTTLVTGAPQVLTKTVSAPAHAGVGLFPFFVGEQRLLAGDHQVKLFWARDVAAAGFLFAIVTGICSLAISFHDWVWLYTGWHLSPMQLGQFVPIVLIVMVVGLLANRLLQSMRTIEAMNDGLRRTLEQRTLELQENYRELADTREEKAIQTERGRIMMDLHDGFSGQLANTLADMERTNFDDGFIKQSLEQALQDLGLILDSFEHRGSIASLLAMALRVSSDLGQGTTVALTWGKAK